MRKPKHWGQPCPNPDCSHYRLINRGNISAISTSMTQSGKRRLFRCSKCERPFSETRDPVFFDLRSPEARVLLALKRLLVKVALSDLGFVLGVTEETVLEWLRRAAQKAQEINAQLLRDWPVTQVQLHEMWSFISRKHAQQAGPDGESTEWSEDGRQWVWISFAPEFRLILAAFVGPRTFASALRLIELTAAVVLGVPCFFRDGFSCSLSALIDVYYTLKTFPRTGKPGLVWYTVSLDTALGIVTQRRCPDASTRDFHRGPLARSSQSDWRGEQQWMAAIPAVFCAAEDRSRPPSPPWGSARHSVTRTGDTRRPYHDLA